jgi:hypothetical protein
MTVLVVLTLYAAQRKSPFCPHRSGVISDPGWYPPVAVKKTLHLSDQYKIKTPLCRRSANPPNRDSRSLRMSPNNRQITACSAKKAVPSILTAKCQQRSSQTGSMLRHTEVCIATFLPVKSAFFLSITLTAAGASDVRRLSVRKKNKSETGNQTEERQRKSFFIFLL